MRRVIVFALFAIVFASESVFSSDVKISKETVKQGGFFEITIDGVGPKDVFTISFNQRRYLSVAGVSARSHRVIIPVHVSDAPGETKILLESIYETVVPQKIIIEKTDFEESEVIEIIQPLSKRDLKKYESEQNILNEIYRKSTKYPFFATIDEPFFEYPLEYNVKISSPFGFIRKRKIIGAKPEKIEKVPHGGIDFVVSRDNAVFAVETGIVRLARYLINSGNTIIIDHGYNIFSVYMHLSQVFVSEGDVVWRRDEIARSGNTGRVTGPHLHFGMKIWNTWVDPKYFIRELENKK